MVKRLSRGIRLQPLREVLSVALFGFLMLPVPADAVDKSGWMTMASEIVGDDTSCGTGKVKHELVIRNLETGDFATPPAAFFQIYDASGNLVDNKSGFGVSTVGPVCFHPDNDSMEITVPNSASYYSFNGGYVWNASQAALVPRGKFIRTTVWLRPKSDAGFDYRHVDPSLAIFSASPTYKVVLNDFPSTYGATGVQRILLYVLDWNTGTITVKTVVTGAPVSGGVGTKTLPAQTLPDGLYTWGYYIALNGNNSLSGGFSTPNVLVGQRSGYNFPFMLDTTPPDFGSGVSHAPAAPSGTDPVTITANASDALSGIVQITVYLDGTPVKTCPYFGVASASCLAPTGPFLPGSTHSYYAVATDSAGNEATSPTQSFTVEADAVCGPANGVPVSVAPSGSANLCSAGTPSSDPASENESSFTWSCRDSEGTDSASCSAPKQDTFKLCLTSCNSGSIDFNGRAITLAPNEIRDLRVCRNVSPSCDTAIGDLTDDPLTTFTATDSPDDAVALTAVKGRVQAHGAAAGDSETVTVSHPAFAPTLSVVFSVPNVCIKDCSDASNVCQGETFDDANNCGPDNCAGTRVCDFNWKEVSPGN